MARHKRFWKDRFLRRSTRGPHPPRVARLSRLPLHLEQLEPRMLMDGAGFINTDPVEDPDSIVGVAGIEAQDDYVDLRTGVQQLRIAVLGNDPLPDESTSLHIKSVSDTLRGASVEISDDGTRIIYTAPSDGVTFDTFYYIVEDDQGNLGKANVNIGSKSAQPKSAPTPSRPNGNDYYSMYEDGPEIELLVLMNDGLFSDGEIIEVVSTHESNGTIRIAEDGKSLFYQPNTGFTGSDSYQYTVQKDGETESFRVYISVKKPVRTYSDYSYAFDIGTGPHVLNVLNNDRILGPISQPLQIESVTQPEYGGVLSVSASGQSVLFEPDEGFLGGISFTYTVRYGPNDYQTVTGYGSVRIENTFLAVDNWFRVDPDSAANLLDVLANDPKFYDGVQLTIVETTPADQGGQLVIDQGGILYTPAEGFTGGETFTYTVEDHNGHRDSATVTVFVAQPVVDPSGVPRFVLPGELEQYLIDRAVEQYKYQFGVYGTHYVPQDDPAYKEPLGIVLYDVAYAAMRVDADVAADYSETNTQEARIDEADIVETDGRHLYTFSHGQLVIVDFDDPANPTLVSFTDFDDAYGEMYVQGDHLTLIDRGSYHRPAVVTVLDISDRAAPAVVERTEIDGVILDSRAVGDRVHVAVSGRVKLPELGSHVVEATGLPDYLEAYVNETLDEYVARVRQSLIEDSLPMRRTYSSDGTLLSEEMLVELTRIHQPIDEFDQALLTLITFDAGDDLVGPVDSTGLFSSAAVNVYMSGNSFYALRNAGGDTAIFKFAIAEDGTSSLVATGKVDGTLLNQFSADEHDGRFRLATTQLVNETYIDRYGRERVRQQRRFNNLFVLEQNGNQLEVVGSVENLAPTETIKSVRFLDDRAYVVTFRVIDPLFAVDLSDPTNPTVEGALKIPGFSDYLHPVGEDYVIGIGRDANEITGQLGPVQITLFYVGDLSNPTVVDQVTMEGAQWANSETWTDHHAVAYFAENGVLTIPVSWSESVDKDQDGDGLFEWHGYEQRSAIWAFEIDVDDLGGGSIEVAGSVEHEGQARRSIRLGDSLVTISQDYVKVNELHHIDQQLAKVYLGLLPVADQFTVQEDSGENVLDVLANDHPGVGGEVPSIVSITQPKPFYYYWGELPDEHEVGTVEIAQDGRSLIFTPAENFFGTVTFTYTILDELRGEQTTNVTVNVENVLNAPEAVNDEFFVDSNSEPMVLDVLANDIDFDQQKFYPYLTPITDVYPVRVDLVLSDRAFVSSDFDIGRVINVAPLGGLSITAVGPTDNGGLVELNDWGQLVYTPAPGFEGVETFTYTVETIHGLSDVGAVTVHVGTHAESVKVIVEEPQEPEPSRTYEAPPAAVTITTPEVGPTRKAVDEPLPEPMVQTSTASPAESVPRAEAPLINRVSSGISFDAAPEVFVATLFDTDSSPGIRSESVDREDMVLATDGRVGFELKPLSTESREPRAIDRVMSSVDSADDHEMRFSLDDALLDCLAHESTRMRSADI